MLGKIKRYLSIILAFLFWTLSESSLAAVNELKGLKYILNCSECHGFDGNSKTSERPNIAGLHPRYLVKQLLDFKSGLRSSPEMDEVIKTIPSDDEIYELAFYFAGQKMNHSSDQQSSQTNPLVNMTLGKEIYTGKRMEYGIPGCASCHGKHAMGDKEGNYPRLNGQHAAYLIKQMKLFRAKKRTNDSPPMMRNIAMMMDDEDIASVAAYIASMSIQ